MAYHRVGRRIAGAAAIEHELTANPGIAGRDTKHGLALARRYEPLLDEPIPPRLLQGCDSSPAGGRSPPLMTAMPPAANAPATALI